MTAWLNPFAPRRKQPTLFIVRITVAAVFIYAGVVKTYSPEPFADSIASFKILPPGIIALIALGLPPFEILAGLLLLLPGSPQRIGALCILLMTLVFFIALGSALARGLTVDCGCFGGHGLDLLAPTRNLWLALGRDVLLGGTAWFLYADALRKSDRVHTTETYEPVDTLPKT